MEAGDPRPGSHVSATAAGSRRDVRIRVNGVEQARSVEPRLLLSDFLRHELGLTGTHVGCEHGVCGACTILMDGRPVRSCLAFAVQADGRELRTVEGLGASDRTPGAVAEGRRGREGGAPLHPLQVAFRDAHGLQCGFCTPGLLMTLVPFLEEHPDPDDDEIRAAISGNLCRCTGYAMIVDAVRLAARRMRGQGGAAGRAAHRAADTR